MRRSVYSLLAVALFLLVTGCEGLPGLLPDDDDDDGTPVGPATTVEETLDRLGVDHSDSPRLAPGGATLPSTYTPVGSTAEFARVDELYLVGIQLGANLTNVMERDTGTPGGVNTQIRNSVANPVWLDDEITSDGGFTRSPRTAIAADVDADGREEMVIVYVDVDDPAHDEELTVVVRQDALHTVPYEETTQVIALQANVLDVTAAAGDWNGDGRDELAVALGMATSARLLFFNNANGVLSEDTAAAKTFTPVNASAPLSLDMKAGQLDYDAGQELAVVINEYIATNDNGIATWKVFDDASAAHAEIPGGGAVSGQDGGTYNAGVASVATGDIDGDGLDEVVIGGFADYNASCGSTLDYIFIARDDAAHSLASLGAKHVGTSLGAEYSADCDDADAEKLRWVQAVTLDTNGDRVKEIAFNQYVYRSFADAAPFTLLQNVGASDLAISGAQGGWLDRSTMTWTAGDTNSDGRQELIVYSQDRNFISFYGDNDGDGDLDSLTTAVTQRNSQAPDVPLIVPVNIDNDTIVVKVAETVGTGGGTGLPGDYKLVFTEPIVLAVLAAMPCSDGIGQNTDACTTTYGTAVSGTTSTEEVVSVSASVSVGVNIDGGALTQSELSLKGTLSTTASTMTGSAYTLTKAVVYETGSMEDAVVFTTLPYDTWTYEVVSHPDPAMVGQPVTISVPREPITIIAERGFFNDSLREGDVKIESNVLQHTVGDLASYPTVAQKNALLGQFGSTLEIGPQGVGQGTGSTEISLAVGEEQSEGGSLEVGFEFELEATVATVMVGFSVGASVEESFQVTSGTETSYSGTIGSLDADHFGTDFYSYGLFTYRFTEPTTGKQFQVLNYWVEQ